MKIISLNVRGLGGTLKRKYLSDLVSKEQVDMVCLQEKKKKKGILIYRKKYLSLDSICMCFVLFPKFLTSLNCRLERSK